MDESIRVEIRFCMCVMSELLVFESTEYNDQLGVQ